MDKKSCMLLLGCCHSPWRFSPFAMHDNALPCKRTETSEPAANNLDPLDLPSGAVIMWCLALCFSLSILAPGDLYNRLVQGTTTDHSQALLQAGVPIWPLLVFDVFSSMTMVLSALAHTFACLPKPTSSIFWKLDQLGIAAGANLWPSAGRI